ncbi:MAG TPA: hypothetical protein VMD79_10465 [Solirubrobacteraceae bacterium]|nr:hypothetical protein [Solirubrobacteraceae bacterium]
MRRQLTRAAYPTAIDAGLLGSFLSAWVVFPAVLLLASVGCGLLVRAAAAGELSKLLITPVGFALVVAICSFTTSYKWLAPATGASVAVAALAGYAWELFVRRARVRRPALGAWVWPALAALAAFTAVGGPVFLTGSVGWTGYTRIVDIALQMDLSQHLIEAGRALPTNGNSSFNIVVTKLLAIGYPAGGQATLGGISQLARSNIAFSYQAYLAYTAAMGALAIFSMLGRVTRNALLRCVGATVAIQPNILYAYSLEAGIKELTTAATLMIVIAVASEGLPGTGSRRRAVPLAVACSAAFGAFSLGIVPWLGLLLVGMLIVSLAKRAGHREALASWGVFAVAGVLLSLPGVITAGKLYTVAGSAVGGVVELGDGNLAAPVSRWSSAGVWLTGDYRYPLANPTPSHIFDVIMLALAALGVVAAVVRRRGLVLVVAASAAIALLYYLEHTGPWIQLKAFTITAAFVVLLAFVGIAALQASRSRLVSASAWLAVLVVAGSVLYGNAVIYRDTTLAPGARYRDLAAIGARYKGQGPTLDPYFDEYAEYFLRQEDGSTIVNPANLRFQVLPGIVVPGGMSFGWDLNQLVPSFLQSFPLIIQPRSPTASRAPSNYDLLETTRYFEVWRRDRPSSTVVEHLPLSNLPHERSALFCKNIVEHVRKAGPGAEVAYARTSVLAVVNPVETVHPVYWGAASPSSLALYGAGELRTSFVLPQSTHYGVWLQGSIGRPLTFYIDGHRLASIGYEERYPDQFLFVGHTNLKAGRHTLRIVRGGGDLHPGDGQPGETTSRTLGVIVFNRENEYDDRVYVAPGSRAEQVCAAPVGYEWMEVLKAGGAPANALPAPSSP